MEPQQSPRPEWPLRPAETEVEIVDTIAAILDVERPQAWDIFLRAVAQDGYAFAAAPR